MRKIWMLGLVALIFSSCITTKDKKNKDNIINPYLPKIFGELKFGMSLKDATTLRTTMAPINYIRDEFGFRKEYVESLDDPSIERVVYYFDAEGNQPFYEVIITYKTVEALNTDAKALFGAPNYEGTEWRFYSKEEQELQAWKFDKKLVIIAVLPGTEWSEESME